MDYNLHTHTWRCGHAAGTEEEYIIRALENGIRTMGFSDHMPFRCADGYEETTTRIPTEQAMDYTRDLRALREKYRDRIKIHIGFEMEYFPDHFEEMLKNARKWGGEFLLLGQHYVVPEHPDGKHSKLPSDDVAELEAYADSLVSGMETGVFTYVAHPDVFLFTGAPEAYRKAMRKVCVASRQHSVPLEINFYGIRDHRYYPTEAFWEVAGEEQCPVTFGFDAHDAISAYDDASLATALRIVEKYGLNYIGRPPLVRI